MEIARKRVEKISSGEKCLIRTFYIFGLFIFKQKKISLRLIYFVVVFENTFSVGISLFKIK